MGALRLEPLDIGFGEILQTSSLTQSTTKMNHELVSSSNVDRIAASSVSPMLFVPPDHRIPSPPYLTTERDFTRLSPQISNPMVSQFAISPPIQCSGKTPITQSSSPVSFEDKDPVAIENRLYLSQLALQNQQIKDRYALCFSKLQDAMNEAENISKKNIDLRRANDVLCQRLGLYFEKHKSRNPMNSDCPPMSRLDGNFRHLSLTEPPDEASPPSVFGFQDNRHGRKFPAVDEKSLTLPKCISIRSTRHLKIHQMGGTSSESNRNIRHRPTTPMMKQKVCLGGAENKDGGEAEDAVELDVCNLRLFKSKLCKNWQKNGECPYGQQCHFTHGIGELRPVIRHPRYKTELCRMILAGDTCPYGHRCHFRHSIYNDKNEKPNFK
ncbi:zinc finger CCCH domain-containing protein 9-like isoform X1 [Dendrobium catenatum]|uniref:zinc finger CCCH domain-containing protein 9-like isoform X1 n=2 Tax=Dendrobium catenatum TaxID=906689 RepID=UPI0010A071CE|nr:zinc finger CCCH domain-containing protein 9-like isoform X1 [Dendrobium catenatum]